MPGSLDALAPPPRRLDRVVVVMPAYNAEATLERTFRDLPAELVSEVILVDDRSSDRTVEIAQRLGITTIRHERNTGYGGNQKTCYATALARGADVLVYDAQYLPEEYAGTVGMSRVGWGHSTYEAGALLAKAAGVGKLVLFHHDPTRTDDGVALIEERARALFDDVVAAREGMTIDLGTEERTLAA